MTYTIHKAVLQPADVQEIMVPEGAEMLSAGEQFNNICVWYRCNPAKPLQARKLAIVGTGHPVPDESGRFLGTAAMHGGEFMFHIFEQAQS